MYHSSTVLRNSQVKVDVRVWQRLKECRFISVDYPVCASRLLLGFKLSRGVDSLNKVGEQLQLEEIT